MSDYRTSGGDRLVDDAGKVITIGAVLLLAVGFAAGLLVGLAF